MSLRQKSSDFGFRFRVNLPLLTITQSSQVPQIFLVWLARVRSDSANRCWETTSLKADSICYSGYELSECCNLSEYSLLKVAFVRKQMYAMEFTTDTLFIQLSGANSFREIL